jgi:F-type H+-transporting ATPase subunit delta
MSKISTKNVAEAIYGATKGKSGADLDKALKHTVEFLSKKNLLSKSKEILKQFEQISDTHNKIVRAKVFSKAPLTTEENEKIGKLLKTRHKPKEPIIQWQKDETLIGGFRIEAGEEIIDLTLKNKVEQLKNYLLNN